MAHRAPEAYAGRISTLVAVIGALLGAVLDLLPAKWAAWVRKSRKAVVTLAGGVASFTAVPELFPPSVAPYVVIAGLIATAIVTYWTPNEAADGHS